MTNDQDISDERSLCRYPLNQEVSSPISSVGPRLVAASVGAIITAVAVTPLDVVKVRQQASSPTTSLNLPSHVKPCPRGCGTFVLNNGLMECVLPKCAVPYFDRSGRPVEGATQSIIRKSTVASISERQSLGTFGMLRTIFLREGFGGIYAGLAPTLVMSVPNTVLYFTAYDEIVSALRKLQKTGSKSNDMSDVWVPLIGGSFARCLASFATAPLELIRTRQASFVGQSGQSPPGLLKEFRTLSKNEGFASLYAGLAPTLLRDVPFSAVYWLFLEKFKAEIKRIDKAEETPLRLAGHAFVSGAAAGMIAAFFTAPFDVVKTRRQMVNAANQSLVGLPSGGSTVLENNSIVCRHDGAVAYRPPELVGIHSHDQRPTSTLSLMKNIVENEGIAGLWRGNQTRMIKIAPACAIMISCYELGKRIME